MASKPGDYLECPISQDILQNAVQTKCRHNFSFKELNTCLENGANCPLCRTEMQKVDIVYHRILQEEADKWKVNPVTYQLPDNIDDISRNQASDEKVYPEDVASVPFEPAEEDEEPSLRSQRVHVQREGRRTRDDIADCIVDCFQDIEDCCGEIEEGVNSCCDDLSDCCGECVSYIAAAAGITALVFGAYSFGIFGLIGRAFSSVVSYIPNPMQIFLDVEF